MIKYKLDDKLFIFRYKELKEEYYRFISMTDQEFIENIIDATHFACYICFIKEIPTYICLSDTGIVHELLHLMKSDTKYSSLQEIRELFKEQLILN